MRKTYLPILIVLSLLGGCAGTTTKTPSEQAKALSQWNDARSSVLIGLAGDEYKNQSFDKSRETIDEALKLSPTNAPAHVLSARLYIEQGQLEAAERDLAVAQQLDPADAEADYLSGIVYERWQQPQRALDFYQLACDKAPAELAYLIAKAETLVSLHRSADALTLLQAKVVYFDHSGVIRDEVGLLLMGEGKYDQASEILRRASILEPDDLTIQEHLGMSLYYAARYVDAVEVLTPLVQNDHFTKRADLWLTLGECHLNIGETSQAVTNFQQATQQLPTSPTIWLSLAKAQLQADNLHGAQIALRRSLSLDANNSQTHLLFGYLYLRQSNVAQALGEFSRASRLDPSDTVSLCMVGLALEKLGRSQQAQAFYERALQLDPTDEMANQLMARGNSHE